LARYRKAIVSAIVLVGAALALILNGYDPTFTQACVALVGPAFAVGAVLLSKNHSIDDLSKAVAQLQGAAVGVVGYFTVVPTDTLEKVTLLVGAVIGTIAVWWTTNDSATG
jgi:hypothetical protein